VPASAQPDHLAARKAKDSAFRIADFKIAFDAQRTVVADGNFYCCQEILPPIKGFNIKEINCPAPGMLRKMIAAGLALKRLHKHHHQNGNKDQRNRTVQGHALLALQFQRAGLERLRSPVGHKVQHHQNSHQN